MNDPQYYYDEPDGGSSGGRTKDKSSLLPARKCVACETTRHKKERPTPQQFRKHLR